VAGVLGMWWSAARAERAIVEGNDAAVARTAAAYLSVVTPMAAGGSYDAPRLVSAANTVAGASFWRGGFQMALGSVALVADTIQLLPLPDSVQRALEEGAASVVTRHTRYRVTVVPLPGAQGQTSTGWAAAWGTLPAHVRLPLAGFGAAVALAGVGVALLAFLREPRPAWRVIEGGAALGLLAAYTLALGLAVYQTGRASTATQLLSARRFIEIASTASGVRQARLPEIGIGLEVRALGPTGVRTDDVEWVTGSEGRRARTVAATPRTQGSLELELTPVEDGLGDLWRALMGWFVLGAVGLVVAGTAAGLSGSAGLFHSAGHAEGPSPGRRRKRA